MKTLNIFIQFLFILNIIYYSNAKPFLDSISSSLSSSLGDSEQEKKDTERDNENYNSFENVDRNVKFNYGQSELDVYYDKQNTSELKPVYIFIFGGAWHSGDKVKFTKVGSLLETNGYVGVLPNYVLFPYGGFEDMVDDVYEAIKWTFENITRFGGDPKRVSIVGYSSGAHLTALTLLKSVFKYSNNEVDLDPLPTLEKVILLNGPYDFDDFSSSIKLLESSDNSLVEQLAKLIFRTPDVSPTDILKDQDDNSMTSLGAEKFIFFYTSLDTQVSENSAKNFMNEMKRVSPNANIQYIYKEGLEHTTLTRGVRNGEKEYEDLFMSLINM